MEVRINKFEQELHRQDPKSSAYLDYMISRLNRQIQEFGLFSEIKKRNFYEKPSVERSKKKLNKLIKSKQEWREGAIRKQGI